MLRSGIQNCGRALELMIHCVILAVGPFLPTYTSCSLDVIKVLSITPVYCCDRNTNEGKNGEGLGTRLDNS